MPQVKKLSVATVFGKIKLSELIEKKSYPVMTVIGSAVGQKRGLSSYGEWTALLGRFRATNAATGEQSEASELYLPDVALLPLQVALSQPDNKGVDFAIRVGVKYVAEDEGHKAGGSPYEYWFEPLLEIGSDDPLARLESRLKAQQAALEAPKKGEDAPAETVVTPKKGK